LKKLPKIKKPQGTGAKASGFFARPEISPYFCQSRFSGGYTELRGPLEHTAL